MIYVRKPDGSEYVAEIDKTGLRIVSMRVHLEAKKLYKVMLKIGRLYTPDIKIVRAL